MIFGHTYPWQTRSGWGSGSKQNGWCVDAVREAAGDRNSCIQKIGKLLIEEMAKLKWTHSTAADAKSKPNDKYITASNPNCYSEATYRWISQFRVSTAVRAMSPTDPKTADLFLMETVKQYPYVPPRGSQGSSTRSGNSEGSAAEGE